MLKWLFGATKAQKNANSWIFGTILVCGILGLIAAFALSVERVQQLINPSAPLLCNFNLIFNCGTVMQTWQAKVFGFPNAFIGLMAYPVVITVAVAALCGVKFPRKFMFAAQVGFLLGLVFSYWLFFESVYAIQVLCPWCLIVTVVTTLLFEALLRYNLRENNVYLPPKLHKKVLGWLQKDYDKLATGAWLAVLLAIILIQFPGIYS